MMPSSAIQSGTKGRSTAILIALVVAVLSIPVLVYAFGANPPLGNTGAPGQGTCASCHGTLTAGSGVTVTAPTTYTPGGAAVSMTVSIPTTGGFELAVLTQSGNAQAGTLAQGTQDAVTTSGAIQYAYSTAETTSWTFLWTPPAANVGNVVLYVTGGTNGTSGSHSYVMTPAAAPTPNFSLSATSPPTVAAGATGNSTITVTPTNGFTGSVNLTASGLPTGVTPSFSPNPATSTSTLTFTASTTAVAGTSTVTVTGTSGTLTHTATVSLTVSAAAPAPDFSLSASPTMVAISQGTSGTSTIKVTPTNGFNGTVSFSTLPLPSGVTASFNASGLMTLTAASTATTGTSTVTVTGTSGTLSHTTTVTLMVSAVVPPDFSLSASPPSLSIAQGAIAMSTITITPQGAFTGTVTLTPSGAPTGVTASINPTTHVLTLSASSTAAAGTSTVTVTGTSGSLSHTTTVMLSVSAAVPPDFSLSASPPSLSIAQGAIGTSTITIAPQGAFTGTVTLTPSGAPTGVTASINPTTHVLTLSASSTAAAGTSTVTITGTSGTLSHTTTVALTVTSPVSGSSLTVNPSSLNFPSLSSGGDDASEGSGTQRLAITSTTGSAVYYTTKETTQSGGSWLMLGSSGGTTPGTLVVSVNTRGLASGTYHGTITITPSGAAAGPQMVPVTLTVGSPTTSSLRVTPRRLTFSFSGTTDTGSKTVHVTSGTGAREFSVAASGGSWLNVSPTSATTPATLTVSVDGRGLSTGTYSGMITLTAGTRKTSVYVTMFVATSTSGGGGDDGSETESQLAVQPIVNDPTNSGTVGAALLDAAGVPVSSGTPSNPGNLALALSKTVHAPAGTSAGAQLVGAENLVKLTELGFDVRQGGHCTANSPHFVVVTSDDVTHVVTGCANGTIQTAPAHGWIRVRFDPANPAQASPPIAPGQSIKSIAIVLDQGPEATPNPGGGLVVLDNIDVNGVIVGKD